MTIHARTLDLLCVKIKTLSFVEELFILDSVKSQVTQHKTVEDFTSFHPDKPEGEFHTFVGFQRICCSSQFSEKYTFGDTSLKYANSRIYTDRTHKKRIR